MYVYVYVYPVFTARPIRLPTQDKIAARLAAIRNDGATPPTSPTNSAATSPNGSPSRGLQRSKDHVVAAERCTTPEQVAVLLQALCRGYLIRVEQFNLLDASVKLLRVEENQWLVVGQGVAEVTDEVVPYVQVIGWKLDQRVGVLCLSVLLFNGSFCLLDVKSLAIPGGLGLGLCLRCCVVFFVFLRVEWSRCELTGGIVHFAFRISHLVF